MSHSSHFGILTCMNQARKAYEILSVLQFILTGSHSLCKLVNFDYIIPRVMRNLWPQNKLNGALNEFKILLVVLIELYCTMHTCRVGVGPQ